MIRELFIIPVFFCGNERFGKGELGYRDSMTLLLFELEALEGHFSYVQDTTQSCGDRHQ